MCAHVSTQQQLAHSLRGMEWAALLYSTTNHLSYILIPLMTGTYTGESVTTVVEEQNQSVRCYFLPKCFCKDTLNIRMVLDLQKSCEASAESSRMSTPVSPAVNPWHSVVASPQLRKRSQSIIISSSPSFIQMFLGFPYRPKISSRKPHDISCHIALASTWLLDLPCLWWPGQFWDMLVS